MSCSRSSQLLTEEEMGPWIIRRLGGPCLKVELKELHLEDAIVDAKRWFAAKKGVDRVTILEMVGGQVEYAMPDDCDAVIDVSFSVSPLDISLIFAPHIFADEKIPYNVFAAPSSVGLYSSLVQSLQYVEMARRVLNAEENWMYFPHRNILIALPDERAGAPGTAYVEYKSSCATLHLLPERDHDLVKRYALAWAKRDLGMIRSKYDSYPTAQGQTRLNGADLLAQAEKEFEKLEQEIIDSAFPMPFITG